MTKAHDELDKILIEILNEGVKGCLVPNDYAKGKIASAKTAIQKAVGECVKAKIGTSNHGNCCTCQTCRNFHDDCTCEYNEAITTISKALREKGLI